MPRSTSWLSVTSPASRPTASATIKASPVMMVMATFRSLGFGHRLVRRVLELVSEGDEPGELRAPVLGAAPGGAVPGGATLRVAEAQDPVTLSLLVGEPGCDPFALHQPLLEEVLRTAATDVQPETVATEHHGAVAAQGRVEALPRRVSKASTSARISGESASSAARSNGSGMRSLRSCAARRASTSGWKRAVGTR